MPIEQLPLFNLSPRDEGHAKVSSSSGGIRSLSLERFKTFKKFEIDFDGTTLLVGANSSGKTTILQAIRLFFWCISVCGRREAGNVFFKKAVMPFTEFRLIPAHDLRELVYQGTTPNKKSIGIVLTGKLGNGLALSFRIYSAYSILMAVEPERPTPPILDLPQFEAIARVPLYIPGFFGVVTKELLAVNARLEELLSSGHHNEVLRNMLLRLKGNDEGISRLRELMRTEFKVTSLDVPFSEKETDFLRAAYAEPNTRISLDFVSAGSGFLQVLQILVHTLQNPSPLLLLDEPDAHMHGGLQRSFLSLLRKFADEEDLQVIMASHSETFLRETSLEYIRVIDSQQSKAANFPNAASLQEKLAEFGIWPDHVELAEILRTRRVLLMEGREDEIHLDIVGRKVLPDWDTRRKLVQTVLTDGSSDSIISRLEYVQGILGNILTGGIKIAHVRDRDLLSDEGLAYITGAAVKKGLLLFVSERRNREAFLVEPSLLERCVLASSKEKIPHELRGATELAKLAESIIIEWCQEQVDELPAKIRHYNLPWIKRACPDDIRDAERRLDAFIRTEWLDPVGRGEIPWKLIDGKAILARFRTSLQAYGIHLQEASLHSAMLASEYGGSMRDVVELVARWTSP